MPKQTPEVLVIGAGVIGLACAFRLAREGKQVLLADRESPGMGASFGNAGHVATEQVFPLASPETVRGALGYLFKHEGPLSIRREYALSILPWLLRFVWAARPRTYDHGVQALSSLQRTAGADLGALLKDAGASHLLKMHGHLVLVERAASVVNARSEIARLGKFGIDAAWISPSQVAEIAPDITAHVEGAIKFTGTGHVSDPAAVCEALHDAYLAAGGKFVCAEIARIESKSHGFSAYSLAGGKYHASQLVLSCGAWSKSLATQLGYPIPLDTERGYHITLPGVFPRFKIPIASYERNVIMTPMSCGLRMTGTVEFGGMKLPPDTARISLLKRHLHALAANIPLDAATSWMGFRPSLPDHLPVLGRVSDGRKLFFAFGHQHLGLTLAGVTARIIAAQIMGRELEIDLSPFKADRF